MAEKHNKTWRANRTGWIDPKECPAESLEWLCRDMRGVKGDY